MKINDHGGTTGAPHRPGPVSGAQGDVRRGRGNPTDSAAPGDRVSVSDEARTLSRLRSQLGDVDAVRTEKVEELRSKIERGEFHVDLKAVARKLLVAIFGERSG